MLEGAIATAEGCAYAPAIKDLIEMNAMDSELRSVTDDVWVFDPIRFSLGFHCVTRNMRIGIYGNAFPVNRLNKLFCIFLHRGFRS